MFENIRSEEFWNQAEQKKEFKKEFVRPHCIILDSEYASMGRMIALKICEQTDYTYYDAEMLLDLLGQNSAFKEKALQYDTFLSETDMTASQLKETSAFISISEQYLKAIQLALSKGPCLIHERAVREQIKALGFSSLTVMCYADNLENKRIRTKTSLIYQHLETDAQLNTVIAKEDQKRRLYHDALSRYPWGAKETYDLCINTEALGKDTAIRLLVSLLYP
ncbi:cytidylate kinase family protein [Veillonella caviae]|uniref:cytidylate kinase family protein n=1 Tax=Veillonella caviae TaxID=248316 RepID=UPI0023549D6B|nr:cytidylate kinase family protein [Veillonella caviae]